MNLPDDGRLSYEAAVKLVQQQPDAVAFAAVPVFGDANDDMEQRAEGARLFILEGDPAVGHRVRFLAGPFFSTAYGANEVLPPDQIPDRVKELRFLPTRLDPTWLAEQLQILIQKLTLASGLVVPQMPDYEHAPKTGSSEAVFPVTFIGREG